MGRPDIILASASPRRRELLEQAGFGFIVDPADVDESVILGETPGEHVTRLALAKALKIAGRHSSGIVVGADTVVVVDGEILGKPASRDDGARMLSRISARTHTVLTGMAAVDAATGRALTAVESTEVKVKPLSPAEIEEYIETGEPMDKAGAYGIQGRAAVFVEGISGCFFNVVGLPLHRLYLMLADLSNL